MSAPTDRPGPRRAGTDRHDADVRFVVDASADEVGVVPWPLLLRDRVTDRVNRTDSYRWVVLATALFGLFTVNFTITILSVAIPDIAEDLGTSEIAASWVITAPMLTFAVIGPTLGKLGDLYGHRRLYLLGLVLALVFSAAAIAASSIGVLIAFRVGAAAGGAAAGPASMAVINRVFSPEERSRAMGFWSMVMAGGPVLGAVSGGPIVENFGWRWIFVGQVPLIVIGLVVSWILMPETQRSRAASFDLAGAGLLIASVAPLLLALNRGPALGWSHPLVIALLVSVPFAAAAFLRVEAAAESPLLPPAYLRAPNFVYPVLNQALSNFAYMGGFILMPVFLSDLFGYGESRISLISIARPLSFAITGPIAGYLVMRTGERSAGVFGGASVALSMIVFSAISGGPNDAAVVGALVLSGIGLGFSAPAMASTIANAVDPDDFGIVGGAQQMVTTIGVVLGIQVMQTWQTTRAESIGEASAYGEAYIVGAIVAALGALTAIRIRSLDRSAESTRDPLPVPGRP